MYLQLFGAILINVGICGKTKFGFELATQTTWIVFGAIIITVFYVIEKRSFGSYDPITEIIPPLY